MTKRIHVIGGGTTVPVRNHFSFTATSFGHAAKTLHGLFEQDGQMRSTLHLTKMADSSSKLNTNQDVSDLVDRLVADPDTRVIVLTAAICDWEPVEITNNDVTSTQFGSHAQRLQTLSGAGMANLVMRPAPKIVDRIRKGSQGRKDIFLVACKTTTGATEDEQYIRALHLLKSASANLVLANDTVTRVNMIVVPEEARYCVTQDRAEVLEMLAKMTLSRSQNKFTRSTVVPGDIVPWADDRVPANLREVVDHCISRGAYKPFRGSTAGHFAVNLGDGEFLTSRRKTNFNDMTNVGLVHVTADGDDKVIARGAKPSVGGQSQRIIFREHPGYDCIVHAHVPAKPGHNLFVQPQWPNECGSHNCGRATSDNLTPQGAGIKAVMLDEHGPNIVFTKDTPASDVIAFIEANFDLTQKTGGSVELS